MTSGRRGPDGLTDLERDICHAVDKGLTNRAAYRLVRPDSKAADITAEHYIWRVRQRPQCAVYLKELKAKSLARHLHAKDQIIEELAAVAFADIWDLMVAGPDGLAVKPLEDLPPMLRRAVSGMSISRTYYGGTVRLKMHDKIRALDKLSQMFGLYNPADRTDKDAVAPAMSDAERAQRLAAILRLAGDGETAKGGSGLKRFPWRCNGSTILCVIRQTSRCRDS